jgi:diaminohydroxyphosphoribosylaminopyrimidine deaminase/5-amino-6-(5-phosphoribosylamino)uracil reductase
VSNRLAACPTFGKAPAEGAKSRSLTPESNLQTTEFDERMMRRALDLAAQGMGLVSPGPLVGCVIVDDRQQIVGEGFYVYEDIAHAETIALRQAGERTRGATCYVSLEPHAHQSRTPPCTDALIKAGIKRVVAAIDDPNPKVSGGGLAQLRAAGIEVRTGVCAEQAARLNEAFIHFMRTGRPFVHLKMAMSLDGKIATRSGDSRWITGEAARARTHELRHQYDAIMVGGGTVRADDPLLTDRSGKKRRRPLLRVVIDKCLRISPQAKLTQTAKDAPVLIFTGTEAERSAAAVFETHGVELVPKTDLPEVLAELGRRSIQTVLVEGGATLAGLLLEAGLIDKVTFFIAPIIIGGKDAPSAIAGAGAEKLADAFQLSNVEVAQHGRDIEITGYPQPRSGH